MSLGTKKFELTGDTKIAFGRSLHRIRAVRDFCDVKAGDLGGWVESETNLSHVGDAWVYGKCDVCGKQKPLTSLHHDWYKAKAGGEE